MDCLADDGGVDGELLAGSDDVGVLDVVPLLDLADGHAEARSDAAQNVAGSNGVNDVVAVVDIGALGLLLPAACAAGHTLEFAVVDFHFIRHF